MTLNCKTYLLETGNAPGDPEVRHFWPQSHNLNTFKSGTLGDATLSSLLAL